MFSETLSHYMFAETRWFTRLKKRVGRQLDKSAGVNLRLQKKTEYLGVGEPRGLISFENRKNNRRLRGQTDRSDRLRITLTTDSSDSTLSELITNAKGSGGANDSSETGSRVGRCVSPLILASIPTGDFTHRSFIFFHHDAPPRTSHAYAAFYASTNLSSYVTFGINGVTLNLVHAYAQLITMFYGAKSLSPFIFCTQNQREISSEIFTEVHRKEKERRKEGNARNVSTYHLSLKKNILIFFFLSKKVYSAFFSPPTFALQREPELALLKYSWATLSFLNIWKKRLVFSNYSIARLLWQIE